MKTLPIRIASAIAGVALLLGSYYFWGLKGLQTFGFMACGFGVFEYTKIALVGPGTSPFLRFWFISISLLGMGITLYMGSMALPFSSVLLSLYVSVALWLLRKNNDNTQIAQALALSTLGFVYCAFFPMLALRLLALPDGEYWFLYLFFVVFAGDTAAYFGGIFLGQRKLMSNISPNKTVAGAVSGLIGSMVSGYLAARWGLPQVPAAAAILLALGCAFLAQNGDLFESLLKRVAGVKDSGQIMPGHGGILDRLDGIYFAAPLVYCLAVILS
jgi:phosphatidate cytidylyltransferase